MKQIVADDLIAESEPVDWTALAALSRHVSLEPATGALVFRNGPARIVLAKDGTVRIEGAKIIQTALGACVISAATIDLN